MAQTKEEESMRKYTLLALASSLLAFAPLSQAANDALYKSLGGKKAIVAVVDDFVGRVAMDNRINSFFKATASDPKRLAKFKKNLVDQICEAAGGPCKYTGKDMKAAHAGMGISGADFDALVGDLVASLDKFMVKEADKMALLGVLGPMKKDIVEK
jgi:hemoglobin